MNTSGVGVDRILYDFLLSYLSRMTDKNRYRKHLQP